MAGMNRDLRAFLARYRLKSSDVLSTLQPTIVAREARDIASPEPVPMGCGRGSPFADALNFSIVRLRPVTFPVVLLWWTAIGTSPTNAQWRIADVGDTYGAAYTIPALPLTGSLGVRNPTAILEGLQHPDVPAQADGWMNIRTAEIPAPMDHLIGGIRIFPGEAVEWGTTDDVSILDVNVFWREIPPPDVASEG